MPPRGQVPTFFPSLETKVREKLSRKGSPRLPKVSFLLDPCRGCSLEAAIKVPPVLPPGRRVTAVGLGPGGTEEEEKVPFVGKSGDLLRRGLYQAGLDPNADVGYANLGRCRPLDDDFDSPAWTEAENRCWQYLSQDLAGGGLLLLLGTRPLQRFTGNAKASVRRERGLWRTLPDRRAAFITLHPSGILRERDPKKREELQEQFFTDLRRMADRILRREKFPEVRVTVYRDLPSASKFLLALARGEVVEKWFFDIETYDVKEIPSRLVVGTDPFHPDFRVRGVAIATGPSEGYWIELLPHEGKQKTAVTLPLGGAFLSGTSKGAFVSGFDANGLIAQGWVPEIRNLTQDPWLAALALNSTGTKVSLERLVVDVLGEPQPKEGVDRARILEMSLEAVAEYGVRDACAEYRLDVALEERLRGGRYI